MIRCARRSQKLKDWNEAEGLNQRDINSGDKAMHIEKWRSPPGRNADCIYYGSLKGTVQGAFNPQK